MIQKNIVITGGSRGVGLGLTREYLEYEHHVVATSTQPHKAEELLELKENFPEHLEIMEFHAEDPNGPTTLAENIGAISSNIDILINNSGIFSANTHGQQIDQAGPLVDLNYEAVNKVLKVNTVAPLILTKELLPLLRNSTGARVINISSGMGSIQEFSWPDCISYSVSKAGLNMVTKALHENLKADGIPVVSVSPGWVRTDMGGSNADLSVEESISDLIPFIDSVNKGMSGGFYRKSGDRIPF